MSPVTRVLRVCNAYERIREVTGIQFPGVTLLHSQKYHWFCPTSHGKWRKANLGCIYSQCKCRTIWQRPYVNTRLKHTFTQFRQSSSKILRKSKFLLNFWRIPSFHPPPTLNQCWNGVILKIMFLLIIYQRTKPILDVQCTFATLILGGMGNFFSKSIFLNIFWRWLSGYALSMRGHCLLIVCTVIDAIAFLCLLSGNDAVGMLIHWELRLHLHVSSFIYIRSIVRSDMVWLLQLTLMAFYCCFLYLNGYILAVCTANYNNWYIIDDCTLDLLK